MSRTPEQLVQQLRNGSYAFTLAQEEKIIEYITAPGDESRFAPVRDVTTLISLDEAYQAVDKVQTGTSSVVDELRLAADNHGVVFGPTEIVDLLVLKKTVTQNQDQNDLTR